MTHLLDTNVLLALAWPQHIHHERVNRWMLAKVARERLAIATCPITELGFVRISMKLKGYAADFQSATRLLRALTKQSGVQHFFWEDDLSIHSLAQVIQESIGPNQLTDAYLTGLAEKRQGILATLDVGIKSPHVELISV